jgi:hypothetical protein
VAESATSHATPEGTTVYFQRNADYECSFFIAIDDCTGSHLDETVVLEDAHLDWKILF